jgi:tripartite-type tricarboxylate transporter receptor subunit TctC
MRSGLQKLVVLLIGSLAFGTLQAAGEAWPTKPITLVVPFTPGGITDNTSRLLARLLGAQLGQAVIVENRPGAGGSIGVASAARQAPDGYTLIYGTQGTHGANVALYKNVGYDPVKDFVPVHALAETPLMLVTNPARPYKTVSELIAFAKANPGKVTYGSAGPGTGTHLTAELFQTAAGIKMTHIPYRGSSPALTDLMAGTIDVMFDYTAVVLPFIQTQKLRALAVTAKKRLAIVPDVPVLNESGLSNAESSAWGAVFVPAKTPPEIVKRLGDEIAKAIVNPEMLQSIEKFGGVTLTGLRDEKLGAFVKSEVTRWRDVVQQSGARLD